MNRTVITALIVLGFFLPALSAHAVGECAAAGVAVGAGAQAASRALGAEVPVGDFFVRKSTGAIESKECILDGLTVLLREALIATITDSIVQWINSGFEGAPAFVTDLRGFLGEVADNTALDFLEGTELGFLCSPFKVEVRLAIATSYQRTFKDRISCSLGDVGGNIEEFFAGNFSQGGGWRTWFKVHLERQNNPYGALAIAQAELEARITSRQNEELKLLEFGGGFFSKRKCAQYQSIDVGEIGYPVINEDGSVSTAGSGPQSSQVCVAWGEILTPGAQINEQLAKTLGLPLEQLALADEIDEIISALMSQLTQQIFTSLDGLRGLSSRRSASAFDGRSYIERLASESGEAGVTRAQEVLIEDVNGAIELQEAYQDVLTEIIAGYETAEAGFVSVFSCSTASSLASQALTASTSASGARNLGADYQAQKTASEGVVARLVGIRTAVENARSVESLNAAAESYEALLATGAVKTEADIVFLLAERDAQEAVFASYDAEVTAGLARCGIPQTL